MRFCSPLHWISSAGFHVDEAAVAADSDLKKQVPYAITKRTRTKAKSRTRACRGAPFRGSRTPQQLAKTNRRASRTGRSDHKNRKCIEHTHGENRGNAVTVSDV